MPRSIKRPQTGQIVWYYANPLPGAQQKPYAAMVVNTIDRTHFGLTVFDGANGTTSYVASVLYCDGTRPAAGAWCTHMRVQEPAANQWPKDGGSEGPLGSGGVVVT